MKGLKYIGNIKINVGVRMIESTCPHKWDFKMYGTCPMCLQDMQNRHSPNYIGTEMLKSIENLSYTNHLSSRYVRMMASELLSLRQQIGQRQAELEFIMQKNMEAAKQEPAQSELLEVVLAMRDWIDAVPQDTQLPAMPGFDRDWANAVIEQAQKSDPAQAVPVAEVVWYDPRLTHPDSKQAPHKIIDASLTFFDEAPVGTKLYTAPPAISEPAQAVPDGYCLMPREPTQWMRVQIECGIESNSVADVWGRLIRAVDLENKHRQSRERNAPTIDDETRKRVLELCNYLHLTNLVSPLPFYSRIKSTVEDLKEKLEAGNGKN